MIDEHQPMQIGMFPMDMKCQTPQQLQLHQHLQFHHQHQQQQHHHPHHNHHHNHQANGNERMLTTSTVAAPMNGVGPQVAPTTAVAATTSVDPATRTTPMANGPSSALASSPTNVNGSCNNNHNNSGTNTTSSNLNNCHGRESSRICSSSGAARIPIANQQSNVCGPGLPQATPLTATQSSATATGTAHTLTPPQTIQAPPTQHALLANAANTLTSVSGRIALGECSLNASGIDVSAVTDTANHQQHQHHHHHHHLQMYHGPYAHQMADTDIVGIVGDSGHDDDDDDMELAMGVRVGVIGLTSGMPPVVSHGQVHHSGALTMALPALSSLAANSTQQQIPAAGVGAAVTTAAAAATRAKASSVTTAHCALCCQPICDRYIMRVVDTSFHEGCLKCATCSLHLVQSCFTRDGKLYCRIDYERLFMRNRCLGCGHKINSEELVMRTLENVFHLKCFACVVCGSMLKKGEQYVVKQGQLFCRFDYEKEVEMLQGYDFYGDDLFPPKLDGRRGPKRPRTILNTQQRRAFKASFEVSPKPCRKVRENLAKETGLSLRIVQVWFQNQRAKVKKIQKKAKQEHPKGTSDSQDSQESDSSCLVKIKDEAHSDTESLLESPFTGGAVGSGSNGVATAGSIEMTTGGGVGVGVGGKLSRCTIKDEHDNMPFNCMETNKENCNKTNEPILNTILGLSYATFQQLMGPFSQSPMINPIDRLYSMQNSYFRPDDPMGYSECGKDMVDN